MSKVKNGTGSHRKQRLRVLVKVKRVWNLRLFLVNRESDSFFTYSRIPQAQENNRSTGLSRQTTPKKIELMQLCSEMTYEMHIPVVP